jgi:hypothetical protein
LTEGEVVAIDGKTLLNSYDKGKDKAAIHMISAWATNVRLVLVQLKVNDKSSVYRHLWFNYLKIAVT